MWIKPRKAATSTNNQALALKCIYLSREILLDVKVDENSESVASVGL
jgi:hypothetical protein